MKHIKNATIIVLLAAVGFAAERIHHYGEQFKNLAAECRAAHTQYIETLGLLSAASATTQAVGIIKASVTPPYVQSMPLAAARKEKP